MRFQNFSHKNQVMKKRAEKQKYCLAIGWREWTSKACDQGRCGREYISSLLNLV